VAAATTKAMLLAFGILHCSASNDSGAHLLRRRAQANDQASLGDLG
jgi:hypothetical protein